MGQEFFINSQRLEDKVRSLLPSQGGAGAGFDLSASTQIIPIIDVTESAEGSNLRQDLQTCVDFASTSNAIVNAANTVIVTTTGFFRVDINITGLNGTALLNIFDGTTSKTIKFYDFQGVANNVVDQCVVYLRAGDSLRGTSTNGTTGLNVFTRQIADIAGNLTNPLGF